MGRSDTLQQQKKKRTKKKTEIHVEINQTDKDCLSPRQEPFSTPCHGPARSLGLTGLQFFFVSKRTPLTTPHAFSSTLMCLHD